MTTSSDLLGSYPVNRYRLICVVDANALLSAIAREARVGDIPRIRLMDGRTTLYAADHVYGEVYRRMDKFATGKPGAPTLDQLRRIYEERYLPIIRFVTLSDVDRLIPGVVSIPDPDDVPTGMLAELLSPCLVASEDGDLRDPGFAPRNWMDSGVAAIRVAQVDTGFIGSGYLSAAATAGVRAAVSFSARKLGVRDLVVYGIAAALIGALLLDAGRRTRAQERFQTHGVPILEKISASLEAQTVNLGRIRDDMYDSAASPTLRRVVARTVALAHLPLDVHELTDELLPDWPVVTPKAVHEVLIGGPEFTFDRDAAAWHVGRIRRPQVS